MLTSKLTSNFPRLGGGACCAGALSGRHLTRVFRTVQAPVGATQRRLQELLEEWPEHPLLVQLQAICNRIMSLPACGPLKSALTGVELLLSRAQTWEEGAASHVSIAPQLAACAALARRWRAAQHEQRRRSHCAPRILRPPHAIGLARAAAALAAHEPRGARLGGGVRGERGRTHAAALVMLHRQQRRAQRLGARAGARALPAASGRPVRAQQHGA